MLPKIIARYLPQFHRIEENDKWWGEGFTEWVTVRRAKPLFAGHIQPRIPLNDNYYNLMEKKTMQWQAELARKYGIYGFSFYHYWFEEGKKVLEKPAENLLKWKDIDIAFCFTWANETWARTWSNLYDKNSWVQEKEMTSSVDNGVLLKQTYDDESVWLEHIRYLLPFFKDKRYIRIDGRPVFILYKPDDIHCLSDMLSVWRRELKKENIDDLYIIGEQMNEYYTPRKDMSAILWRFPNKALIRLKHKNVVNGLLTYDYDEYWKKILTDNWRIYDNENEMYCVSVDYDDTPRRGLDGWMLLGANPEKFNFYFTKFLKKIIEKKHKFVFINAWNEWGEGAYLEPDNINRYDYLEKIKKALETVGGENNSSSIVTNNIVSPNIHKDCHYMYMKEHRRVKLLHNWLLIKENKKNISMWLEEKNIRKVAIYGMGYLGRHLIEEINNSGVIIEYIIDKRSNVLHAPCPVYKLGDDLPEVDAIVVTLIGNDDEIHKNIRNYVQYKILSLEYILREMV